MAPMVYYCNQITLLDALGGLCYSHPNMNEVHGSALAGESTLCAWFVVIVWTMGMGGAHYQGGNWFQRQLGIIWLIVHCLSRAWA